MRVDETDDADTVLLPRALEISELLITPGGGAGAAVSPSLGSGPGTGIVTQRSYLDADTVVRHGVGAQGSADGIARGAEHGGGAHDGAALVEPQPAAPSNHPRVSINGAAPVTLDVPRLVGRNPRAPRVVSGTAPLLVTVPSPRGEVSATHLELSQVGTSIVITDLRSTNGTVVTMPGAMPLTMRAGESLVAVPGTIVEIGDGNGIEILPPPRLRPAGSNASELGL